MAIDSLRNKLYESIRTSPQGYLFDGLGGRRPCSSKDLGEEVIFLMGRLALLLYGIGRMSSYKSIIYERDILMREIDAKTWAESSNLDNLC
jgi:hypothetical protein